MRKILQVILYLGVLHITMINASDIVAEEPSSLPMTEKEQISLFRKWAPIIGAAAAAALVTRVASKIDWRDVASQVYQHTPGFYESLGTLGSGISTAGKGAWNALGYGAGIVGGGAKRITETLLPDSMRQQIAQQLVQTAPVKVGFRDALKLAGEKGLSTAYQAFTQGVPQSVVTSAPELISDTALGTGILTGAAGLGTYFTRDKFNNLGRYIPQSLSDITSSVKLALTYVDAAGYLEKAKTTRDDIIKINQSIKNKTAEYNKVQSEPLKATPIGLELRLLEDQKKQYEHNFNQFKEYAKSGAEREIQSITENKDALIANIKSKTPVDESLIETTTKEAQEKIEALNKIKSEAEGLTLPS